MPTTVLSHYQLIRRTSEDLVKNLSDADMTVQSMPDASPAKWHLAHTTWFFETFLLKSMVEDYQEYDPHFCYLFNSYYESVGQRYQRAARGLISRPSKEEILAYRTYVDEAMGNLIDARYGSDDALAFLLDLGLHHEQQHQELLQTDILHLFAQNPLFPVYALTDASNDVQVTDSLPKEWIRFAGADHRIGHDFSVPNSFAYDNEGPQHRVHVPAFELCNNLVTKQEWLEFVEAGGYQNPLLWLADGWAKIAEEQWQCPVYWHHHAGQWHEFGLNGLHPIDWQAPVRHVSYFEADAFVTWKRQQEEGVRLPTEYEWEVAVTQSEQVNQAFGQVWQWTKSPYVAYPGFKVAAGAVGEYNGKFMCNQFVLRGSSCVTSAEHARITYRNFFYPHQRWQFSGLRLARDV